MNKRKLVTSLVLAGLSLAAVTASAQTAPSHKEDKHVIPAAPDSTFTGNAGVYSQYIFRGLAQTNGDPALQGGLDYAHSSGFYAGAWGSNVSWLRENITTTAAPCTPLLPCVAGSYAQGGSLELDLYAGYKGSFASDFTYDVGILKYWYPGTVTAIGQNTSTLYNVKADTTEVYAALGWKWLSAKYSHSLGDTFGTDSANGTYYLDLSATYPVAETGLTLGVHYGIQKYKGSDPRIAAVTTNDELYSYNDYRISAAYDMGKSSKTLTGVELGIMYTGTSSASPCGYGAYNQVGTASGAACAGVYPKDISNNRTTAWLKKTF